jgi:hypothetical protein
VFENSYIEELLCYVDLELIRVLAPVLKFFFRPNSNHRSVVHSRSKAVRLLVITFVGYGLDLPIMRGAVLASKGLPDAKSVDTRVPLPMHLFHLPPIG